MRRSFLILFALCITGTFFGSTTQHPNLGKKVATRTSIALHDGDLLFQTNQGGQSEAITLASASKWTHVGIAFNDGGEWMVYEAVGPVTITPLKEWAKHGIGNKYAVKRWMNNGTELNAEAAIALRKSAQRFMGLAYDWQFGWSDDKIYCSELVWKMYAEALNVELCSPKPMREHTLGSAVVQRTMKERYGATPPLDELMIAPGALYDCPLLVTISSGE